MDDIRVLTEQVQKNCHISDAKYAGHYSICGLALRLMDLYKWENGLAPWAARNTSEILDWIGEREEAWENLANNDFIEIRLNGTSFDPFNADEINALISAHGLFYGAGYIHGMKPTFFLAPLEEKIRVEKNDVYILGRELARDLISLPALSQNRSVVIRKESGKVYLWNQILFIKQSGRRALRFALERHGLTDQRPETLRRHLDGLFAVEMGRYIYHEVGEISDRVFKGEIWREIISTFTHTPVELLVRAIKDLLADTGETGTLAHIIEERNETSLGFYVAFLDGLQNILFPEIREAFSAFMEARDWRLIEQAVSEGYGRAKESAEAICHIYTEGKRKKDLARVQKEIQKRFLSPLGIVPGAT